MRGEFVGLEAAQRVEARGIREHLKRKNCGIQLRVYNRARRCSEKENIATPERCRRTTHVRDWRRFNCDWIGRCDQNESETDILLTTVPFFTTAMLLILAVLTMPLVTTLAWRTVCVMPTTALWLIMASWVAAEWTILGLMG
jgi:hypothetical protein